MQRHIGQLLMSIKKGRIILIAWGIILFLLILTANIAHSKELFEMNTSVRALGMGNAYTAIVHDSDCVFYNPAGLAIVCVCGWHEKGPGHG